MSNWDESLYRYYDDLYEFSDELCELEIGFICERHYGEQLVNCTATIDLWGCLCQTQVSKAGTSNYIPQLLWNVITCPDPWYQLLAHSSPYVSPIWRNDAAYARMPRFGAVLLRLSWQGNVFRIAGPLWGESTGRRWVLLAMGQWCRALMFYVFVLLVWTSYWIKDWVAGAWFETPWRICDAAAMGRHWTKGNVIEVVPNILTDQLIAI